MHIGILADSHDNLPAIEKAVQFFNTHKVQMVLHAGDFISPFCAGVFAKLNARFVGVFGNNDAEHTIWHQRVQGWGEVHVGPHELQVGGKSIVMMHEPYQLPVMEKQGTWDVIIYGHTHRIDIRQTGKTLVINPGECGGWLSGHRTVAVLDLPRGSAEIHTLA